MFTINNIEWYIKFVSPGSNELRREDGSITIGMCDGVTKTIYLDSSLRGPKLKKVICHELTHAAMFSYGIILTLDQEELLADIIATYGEEIIKITNELFDKIKKRRLFI